MPVLSWQYPGFSVLLEYSVGRQNETVKENPGYPGYTLYCSLYTFRFSVSTVNVFCLIITITIFLASYFSSIWFECFLFSVKRHLYEPMNRG